MDGAIVFYKPDTVIIRNDREGFCMVWRNFSDPNFRFIPGLMISVKPQFLKKTKGNNNWQQ